jgi:hypothetical protein
MRTNIGAGYQAYRVSDATIRRNNVDQLSPGKFHIPIIHEPTRTLSAVMVANTAEAGLLEGSDRQKASLIRASHQRANFDFNRIEIAGAREQAQNSNHSPG